ncbi:MAG TPA: serine/threonine-protein kinase, partial [Methylibium sp.]
PAEALPEHDALRPGTRLGEFEIERVLGVGGFGIVYLAFDHALERRVALKEYMPAALAARGRGAMVSIRSSSHAETFGVGLRSFVNEAKLLARFDHPSLVKVYRFWEDNGTAYMVMPYYEGRTLRETRKAMSAPPDEAWLRALLEPLLGALEVLHAEQVYHRDIAPDNILLLTDGRPVLLDFGAARRVIGDRTQTLTAILKPNFAPIEQYAETAGLRQGPWTDLYSLGAVVHFCLSGQPPTPAAARAVHDELPTVRTLAATLDRQFHLSYGDAFVDAIDACLAVRPQGRPASVAALRAALRGEASIAYPPTQPYARDDDAHRDSEPGFAATQLEPRGRQEDADATIAVPRAVLAGGRREPTLGAPVSPPPARSAKSTKSAARQAPRKSRAAQLASLGLAVAAIVGAAWFLSGRLGVAPLRVSQAASAPAAAASVSAPAVAPPAASAAAEQAVAAASSQSGTTAAPADAAAQPPLSMASAAAADLTSEADLAALAAGGGGAAAAASAAPSKPKPRQPARRDDSGALRPRPGSLAATAAPVAEPQGVAQPLQAAAPAAQQAPHSPREACGKRVFLAMYYCIKEQCEKPEFAQHPQCRHQRAQDEANRPTGEQ